MLVKHHRQAARPVQAPSHQYQATLVNHRRSVEHPVPASTRNLCSLDLVNRGFQTSTASQWKVLTFQKFGLTNGKKRWKVGASFLKRPILFELEDSGDFGVRDYYAASAQTATNQSILVTVSGDINPADSDHSTVVYFAHTYYFLFEQA
jgi:hypothetical protein